MPRAVRRVAPTARAAATPSTVKSSLRRPRVACGPVTGSDSRHPEVADTAAPEPAASGRIAFLGLGIMGSRMARNLRGAGFDVVVWNRTRARADELGEPVAATPREAAHGAAVAITMVVDAPQVEAVL